MSQDGPYTMRSCKRTRTFADLTLDEVIAAAKAHDEEYQPAYGTTIEDARGDVVWSSEMRGNVVWSIDARGNVVWSVRS